MQHHPKLGTHLPVHEEQIENEGVSTPFLRAEKPSVAFELGTFSRSILPFSPCNSPFRRRAKGYVLYL